MIDETRRKIEEWKERFINWRGREKKRTGSERFSLGGIKPFLAYKGGSPYVSQKKEKRDSIRQTGRRPRNPLHL